MRRGVIQALAWAAATCAATAVSWYGVRTVLAGTAYEPPRALPLTRTDTRTDTPSPASPPPLVPAVQTPDPGPSVPPTPPGTPSARPAAPEPSAAAGVRSFPVKGGRVVFDLGTSSATLVSATPDEGRRMRVWTQDAWIRVDFVAGTATTSVFVTWNGHPPQVRTVEN
ncbi:hypothetical protein [Streptomyces sp. NPDC049555]|uniref:hypothetical protein n=1 Tax=Streptomyces sp. NPDC049555 TaxID=3154930 RepID=UPI0034425DA8